MPSEARTESTGIDTFDAIVVGGRIAGCATAINLSRYGMRVLVVDRVKFPKTTVSTHLMKPDSVVMLHKLGLASELERINAPRLNWFHQDFDGFVISGRLPSLHGCDYGYCIRREVLDNALVAFTSKQPGVQFLEEFRVSEVIWERGRVIGIRGTHKGVKKEVRGRIVIGADGRYSSIVQAVQPSIYWRVRIGRAAFYGYFRDVRPAARPTIQIFVRGSDWFYLFPSDGNLHLVAIGTDSKRLPEFGPDRYNAFVKSLDRCPELSSQLSDAEAVSPIYLAHSPTAVSYFRRPSGAGWALVGDAGLYFDPLLGQGMGVALRSAEILADEVKKALDTNRPVINPSFSYEVRRNLEYWDLYAYTSSLSSARVLTTIEKWFYRKISRSEKLTNQYLAVASHTIRVIRLLLYYLLHPVEFFK